MLQHVGEADDADRFAVSEVCKVDTVRLDAEAAHRLDAGRPPVNADRPEAELRRREQQRAVAEADVEPRPARHVWHYLGHHCRRDVALLLQSGAGLLMLERLGEDRTGDLGPEVSIREDVPTALPAAHPRHHRRDHRLIS